MFSTFFSNSLIYRDYPCFCSYDLKSSAADLSFTSAKGLKTLVEVNSILVICKQAVLCDQCRKFVPAQYHLTMSDASVRNFCSYGCVMSFQSQFTNPPNPKQVASLANQKQVVSLGNQKQVVSVGNQKQVVSVGNQKLVVQPSPVNQQVTTTRSGRVVTRGIFIFLSQYFQLYLVVELSFTDIFYYNFAQMFSKSSAAFLLYTGGVNI